MVEYVRRRRKREEEEEEEEGYVRVKAYTSEDVYDQKARVEELKTSVEKGIEQGRKRKRSRRRKEEEGLQLYALKADKRKLVGSSGVFGGKD